MQKTIFITGASAGLGKATAKLFQSKGWHIIATMRNPENEKELNQLPNVTILKLDVTAITTKFFADLNYQSFFLHSFPVLGKTISINRNSV